MRTQHQNQTSDIPQNNDDESGQGTAKKLARRALNPALRTRTGLKCGPEEVIVCDP